MLRTFSLLFACLLGVACSTAPPLKDSAAPVHETAANAHLRQTPLKTLVDRFEDPERDEWQKPQLIIHRLGDIHDKIIADIGAGTGYFTFRLAQKAEKVLAVDIDQRFIDYIEDKNARLTSPLPIETILAVPDDPKLPQRIVDIALLVNTYHHIANRIDYLKTLKRELKPDANLLIVDFKEKELPVGPPARLKLSYGEVIDELIQAGYRITSLDLASLPYQYFIMARAER